MSHRLLAFAFTLVFGLAASALAADTPTPVRMGSGIMTFDTVPGWGLQSDGKSAIGPCHGGVAVDKQGNIYTSAHAGVFVFSPEGKVVRSFLGDKYSDIHDLKIRDEPDGEFLYGARNANAEGIKFNAATGEVVLEVAVPPGVGAEAEAKFSPTAITVAPERLHLPCRTAMRAITSSNLTRPASISCTSGPRGTASRSSTRPTA